MSALTDRMAELLITCSAQARRRAAEVAGGSEIQARGWRSLADDIDAALSSYRATLDAQTMTHTARPLPLGAMLRWDHQHYGMEAVVVSDDGGEHITVRIKGATVPITVYWLRDGVTPKLLSMPAPGGEQS